MSTPLPIEEFFARYPNFQYNNTRSATKEFRRLSKFCKWRPGTDDYIIAKRAFQSAQVEQFNNAYGSNEHSIRDWRLLAACIDISPTPYPNTVDECKQLFQSINVNIVDLIDAVGTDDKVTTFATVAELSIYTRKSGKYFPKAHAKAGGLLKFLLRMIGKGSSGKGGGGGGNPGRRRRRRARAEAAAAAAAASAPP